MGTIRNTKSKIHNTTLSPHSVFMCFVWISEQTAIISLYSINWLVFITETECVYWAVRTGYLDTIRIKFSLACVMTHVVNRLRPNSKTQIWSQFRPSEICGGQSGNGDRFFLLYLIFPLSESFHQCSTLIFIHTLLLSEGQAGETWKSCKMQCSVGNLIEFRKPLSTGYKSVHCHSFLSL